MRSTHFLDYVDKSLGSVQVRTSRIIALALGHIDLPPASSTPSETFSSRLERDDNAQLIRELVKPRSQPILGKYYIIKLRTQLNTERQKNGGHHFPNQAKMGF
jgi:hypothetical protein